MSFIEPTKNGKIYAPGYFLADPENCIRLTKEISQTGAVSENGGKYVPMGTLYTETTEVEGSNVTDYIGFVYEDVDVTSGNMPGSVVTKGTIIESRLPATLTEAAKEALEAKGFVFVTIPDAVTRPY